MKPSAHDASKPSAGRVADIFGFLAAIAIAAPSLAYPFGNDQALHAYIGRGLLQGELPFVNAISSKPIGIFLVHALAFLGFGVGQWAIRMADIVGVLLIGALVASLVTRGPRPRPGELGLGMLVTSALYYGYFDYWDTAHPELWEGAFMLAAVLVVRRHPRSTARVFWLGVLSTVAVMMKFTAFVIAFTVVIEAAWRILFPMGPVSERPTWRRRGVALTRAMGAYLAGIAVVTALCVLPFALGGALEPMWEVLVDFVLHYRGQAEWSAGIPRWLRLAQGGPFLIAAALGLASGLVAAAFRRDRGLAAALGWTSLHLVGAALSVAIQQRYHGYHWVVLTPFAATLVAQGIGAWELSGRKTVAMAAVLAIAILSSRPGWRSHPGHDYLAHTSSAWDYARGEVDRSTYLADFRGMNQLDRYDVMEWLGLQIRERARPGDTLCVRGFATPIYTVTGLRCPSRHIVQQIVPGGLPGWSAEYRETLEREPPTYIVTFRDGRGDVNYLTRRGYRPVVGEGLFLIMRRGAP